MTTPESIVITDRPIELLRWRDLAAQLYVSPERNSDRHRQVFRVLLQAFKAIA